MSLRILGEKAVILFLILAAAACIYFVNNKSIFWPKSQQMNIGLSDINIGHLTGNDNNNQQSVAEPKTTPKEVVKKIAKAPEKTSLESIQQKINLIAIQVNQLQREVNDYNNLVQIERQIQEISQKIDLLYGQG